MLKKKFFFLIKGVSDSRMMTSSHTAVINRYYRFGRASRINVDYKMQWMTMTSASVCSYFLNNIGPMPASIITASRNYRSRPNLKTAIFRASVEHQTCECD